MAGQAGILDDPEVRAKWSGFAWTDANAAKAKTIVARYPEAIAQVRVLARRLRVDGWYTGDHTHYARVAACRAEGDAQAVD